MSPLAVLPASAPAVLVAPSMLDTILALAAMFLGLSLAVQVIQELWKFLTSTKAGTYRMVLRDALGPWVDQLYEAGPASAFQVRGPLQFLRSNPKGVLLPMKKEELLEAMDTVASDWLGYGLETLKQEVRLQESGTAPPSPHFHQALEKITTAGDGDEPEGRNARQVQRFFDSWLNHSGGDGKDGTIDARRLLEGFYQEFFPDRLRVERSFGQIQRNFDHAYHRRNLCLSFLFGLILAVLLSFPFDALYRQASSLSPEEAQALAETMIELSKERGVGAPAASQGDSGADSGDAQGSPGTQPDDSPSQQSQGAEDAEALRQELEKKRQELEQILTRVAGESEELFNPGMAHLGQLAQNPVQVPWFLFNCLITAILISFGAPFWHRLSSALLQIRQAQGGGGAAGSDSGKTQSGKGA